MDRITPRLTIDNNPTARDFLKEVHARYAEQGDAMDEAFENFMTTFGTREGERHLAEYRRLLAQERAYNDLQRARAEKLGQGAKREDAIPGHDMGREIAEAQRRANDLGEAFLVFAVGAGDVYG